MFPKEPDVKPQNLIEEIEKKKQKQQKSMFPIQMGEFKAVSGFEEAFQEFATSGIQNSQKNMAIRFDTPLVRKELPAQKTMDVSGTQVRTDMIKSWSFIY